MADQLATDQNAIAVVVFYNYFSSRTTVLAFSAVKHFVGVLTVIV